MRTTNFLVLVLAAAMLAGCGGSSPSFSTDGSDGGGGDGDSDTDSDADLDDPELTAGAQILAAADPKLDGFDEWPLRFELDPGEHDGLSCELELTRDDEVVRELDGTVETDGCAAVWDGLDSEGEHLAPGPVDVTARVFLADEEEPVAEAEAAVEVLRLGIGEIQLSAVGGTGSRVSLLWAEMDDQLEGYWELPSSDPPWRLGPDSSEDAAAVDLELADGTPRELPEPWTDVKSPPLDSDSSDGSEQDTFNLPTAFEVGSELTVAATLSGATAGDPDGYDPQSAEVRAVAPSGTTLEGTGEFGPGLEVTVTTGDDVVPAVGLYQLELEWTFEARFADGEWLPIPGSVTTTHNLYGVLGQPVMGFTTMPHRAWVEVVDQVAEWVDGESADPVDVASIVTHGIYDDTALFYDTAHGACHYTYYPGWGFGNAVFEVAEFQRRAYGDVVNCTDCGGILSTYVNMIGGDFGYHILRNGYGGGFDLNYIAAIGATEFDETPFDDNGGSFSYHAVVGPADGTIYDATLLVDGDGTPTAPPHEPLYPTAMPEYDYLVALSSQASQIEVTYDDKYSLQNVIWKGIAAPAATGHAGPTRAGVPLGELLPEGLVPLTVRPPAAPGLPARIAVGDRPDGAPLAVVEVAVTGSDGDALAALEIWKQSASGSLFPSTVPVGDRSFGSDQTLGFTRDNLMVAVLTLAEDISAFEIGEVADAAIRRQPLGEPFAGDRRQLVDDDDSGARSVPVALPIDDDYLSAAPRVSGPGYARRTAEGWVLVRTGSGPLAVTVDGVDHRLRAFR